MPAATYYADPAKTVYIPGRCPQVGIEFRHLQGDQGIASMCSAR